MQGSIILPITLLWATFVNPQIQNDLYKVPFHGPATTPFQQNTPFNYSHNFQYHQPQFQQPSNPNEQFHFQGPPPQTAEISQSSQNQQFQIHDSTPLNNDQQLHGSHQGTAETTPWNHARQLHGSYPGTGETTPWNHAQQLHGSYPGTAKTTPLNHEQHLRGSYPGVTAVRPWNQNQNFQSQTPEYPETNQVSTYTQNLQFDPVQGQETYNYFSPQQEFDPGQSLFPNRVENQGQTHVQHWENPEFQNVPPMSSSVGYPVNHQFQSYSHVSYQGQEHEQLSGMSAQNSGDIDTQMGNSINEQEQQYWYNQNMGAPFEHRILENRKPMTHLQKLRIQARMEQRARRRQNEMLQAQRRAAHYQWLRQYRYHAAQWRRQQRQKRRRRTGRRQYSHYGQDLRSTQQQQVNSQLIHPYLTNPISQGPSSHYGYPEASNPRGHKNGGSYLQPAQQQQKQRNYPTSIQAILQQDQPTPTPNNYYPHFNQYSHPSLQNSPTNQQIGTYQSELTSLYSSASMPGQQVGQFHQTVDITHNSNGLLTGPEPSRPPGGSQSRQRFPFFNTMSRILSRNRDTGHKRPAVLPERGLEIRQSSLSLASAAFGTIFSSVWEIVELLIGSISLFLYVLYSAVTVPLG